MSNSDVVADGKVITLQYTLKSGDGEVIDKSEPDQPLHYLHGAGNIVPGLESAIAGKAIGHAFQVSVTPEDGYGVRSEIPPQPIPRDAFPEEMPIEEGVPFLTEAPDGELMQLWIVEVQDDVVLVDVNHPLAGETLHFDVEVMGIRDASDEEVAHGHPHGPGGHHH